MKIRQYSKDFSKISDIPLPPSDKEGWPWVDKYSRLSDCAPDRTSEPRVSIVTPSFNQAQFLEETIRSVLLQGYTNLEYIIIDGGSTDGSVEIIRKYEPWLAYWVSEHDRGQSDALMKGFLHATGQYIAWINSDDIYLPTAFARAAAAFMNEPGAALIYGGCELINYIDSYSNRIWNGAQCTVKDLILKSNSIPQPAAFMRRAAFEQAGGIDVTLHYVMDHELWIRLGRVGDMVQIPDLLARFRFHPNSKTVLRSLDMLAEWQSVLLANTWFKDEVTPAELVEANHRLEVRMAAECLLAGDLTRAVAHLDAAFEYGFSPFGTPDAIIQYMSRYTGLSGRLMTPERLAIKFQQLRPSNLTPETRRLRSNAIAYDHIEKAFQKLENKDYESIRRHLAIALSKNPGWLKNKGVLWMGAEAIVGERQVGKARKLLNQLRRALRGQFAPS